MTIRATNSNTRPILTGGKTPTTEPGQAGPLLTVPEYPKRDRLQLTSEAAQKSEEAKVSTTSTQAEVVSKVEASKTGTVQAETTKTETATGADTKKSEEAKKPLRNRGLSSRWGQNPFAEQETFVQTALGGQATSFKNKAGASVELTIVKGDKTSAGFDQYKLKVGNGAINVTVAPGLDAKMLLAKLVDYYTRVPEHLRGNLKEVALENRHNPTDAYWAKVYGQEEFSSAATAGGGLITFWNLAGNPINFGEDTFHHEMGHLIGDSLTKSRKEHATMVPPGWEEAAKADNDRVSRYSGMNPDEDFAETWSYYIYGMSDPAALEALRERVPNRVEICEAIYRNEFDGKRGKGKSND